MRAHDRSAIDKALGMPWLDFMFGAYVQTGSVERAAVRLIDASGSDVHVGTVSKWWTQATRNDPSLWPACILARSEALERGIEVLPWRERAVRPR